MLRMTVLASGSKGNSTVVTSTATGTSILIDAGLSCRELVKRMRVAGEDPSSISAVIVTHEHQDHVNGLGVFARKFGIPVYFTGETHEAWKRWVSPKAKRITREQWFAQQRAQVPATPFSPAWAYAGVATAPAITPEITAEEVVAELQPLTEPDEQEAPDPTELPGVEYFESGKGFAIGNVEILPFTVPHDAADPVGFLLTIEGIRIGMVTDLGYMPSSVRMHLKRCDALYIESNHDLEMLRVGPYPWSVKQRVLSRVGHLSNDALAEFFTTDYDGSAAAIILAHLSEANNDPNIAQDCALRALGQRSNLLSNRVLLARQSEPLEPVLL